jgi:hypothetical protein
MGVHYPSPPRASGECPFEIRTESILVRIMNDDIGSRPKELRDPISARETNFGLGALALVVGGIGVAAGVFAAAKALRSGKRHVARAENTRVPPAVRAATEYAKTFQILRDLSTQEPQEVEDKGNILTSTAAYIAHLQAFDRPPRIDLDDEARRHQQFSDYRARMFGDDSPAFQRGLTTQILSGDVDKLRAKSFEKYVAAGIIAAVADDLRTQLQVIKLAFVRTPLVNASAALAPNGEPFIMFDAGLLMMMSYYAELHILSYYIGKKYDMKAAENFLGTSYHFIIDYFANEGNSSFPSPDLEIVAPEGARELPGLITLAAEAFVLWCGGNKAVYPQAAMFCS